MGSFAVALAYGLVPLAVIGLAWRAVRRDYTAPQEGDQ